MRSFVLLALAGCSFNAPSSPSDGRRIDGSRDGVSGEGGQPGSLHLLISEVEPASNGEMIEIYNPSETAVDLSDYYLSDHQEYWRLPANGVTPLVLEQSDFLVRFPGGDMIPPGGVITIACDGLAFETHYLTASTYAIANTATSRPMGVVVATNMPGITNQGEMVVLFQWDGASDLVRDVDLLITGKDPDSANLPTDKTGVMVDGPDIDGEPTAYLADSMALVDFPGDAPSNKSHQRKLREGDNEVHAGGNGISGDDETSENIELTWDTTAIATTPGVVPPTLTQ